MLMIGLRSISIYKMSLLILISNKQCQANRKRKELAFDRKKKKLGDRKTRRSKMLLLQIPHFYSTDRGRSTTKSIGVLKSIKNSPQDTAKLKRKFYVVCKYQNGS